MDLTIMRLEFSWDFINSQYWWSFNPIQSFNISICRLIRKQKNFLIFKLAWIRSISFVANMGGNNQFAHYKHISSQAIQFTSETHSNLLDRIGWWCCHLVWNAGGIFWSIDSFIMLSSKETTRQLNKSSSYKWPKQHPASWSAIISIWFLWDHSSVIHTNGGIWRNLKKISKETWTHL